MHLVFFFFAQSYVTNVNSNYTLRLKILKKYNILAI